MSDVNKPIEEPVAAPAVDTPVAESAAETKAIEEPAATEPASEAAVPAAEASKAKDPEPVEEGVLTYKGPGLIKTIFPSKKFFWFGSEAIEEKSLASYIRGEKEPNHNIAWAAHTGKGLLLFSKKSTEKATPAGIINLADISDVVTEDSDAFHFSLAGHKHSFVAANTAERDGWVLSLKAKTAEAKELAPTVKEHETYKSKLDALKKPVTPVPVAAAVTPAKSTEDKAEAKEEKKEDKDTKRNRSASRKRTSIFGTGIFGGKKEEAAAEPKADATEAEAPAADAAPVEATPVADAAAPVLEAPAPAPAEVAPVETPKITKRNSIFGTIQSKFAPKKETKAEAEAAPPAVPAKDSEPVAESAPVIPAVEATEPLAASTMTPATVPTEVTTNGEEAKVAETPATKEKRKTSIPWLTKKEKATSDEETEKPKSPFSNLRNTFKGKQSKAKTPAPEVPAAAESSTAAEATPAVESEAKAEEPVVSEPVAAAPVSSPVVSATA